jgi:hypothetical protein
MPQVGLIIFLTCSIILFSLKAKQNYRFPATGLPVEVKRTVLFAKVCLWLSRHLTAQKVLNSYGKLQNCCFAGDSSKAQSPLSPHTQWPLKINTMDSITDRSSDQLRSVSPESCVGISSVRPARQNSRIPLYERRNHSQARCQCCESP